LSPSWGGVPPEPPAPDLAGEPLADLPLRQERGGEPAETRIHTVPGPPAAAMGPRGIAFAADLATVLLVTAAALLAATAACGEGVRFSGLAWAAVFGLYLSFFATVLPLLFFGKTVGLALGGLRARGRSLGPRLDLSESIRRWAGTFATAAALGLPLLFTWKDREMPTPADRLSGRPLVEEE